MVCPRSLLAVLGICWFVPLPAQGEVNASLLKALPAVAAPSTPAGAAVAKARGGVVHVFVEVDGAQGKFPIERPSSGACIDASGLVVTFGHLVQEVQGAADKRLLVQLDDATRTVLPATIVRLDEATGLALLRVSPPAAGLQALELGADAIAPGEPVVVIACPEGKDVLAFAGVASPALGAVGLAGGQFGPADLFLCDARNDERGDGGAVVDGHGRLAGLFATEHVQRDKSEPTLEQLQRPSFAVVVPVRTIRSTFGKEFAELRSSNPTLHKAASLDLVGTNAAAVARIAPSVVGVWGGEGDWPVAEAGDPGAVRRRDGLGSGVVLGERGIVVTNAHLCARDELRIKLADGRTFPAKVQKRHGSSNLALLQAELPAGVSLPVADCNPDDDAILGETVLAVGNPLGNGPVVTAGVVSAVREREGGRIQADANLGNQNAGGACIDVFGRVLGIADGGAQDPLVMQFAMRGDRVTTETNLSTFVGIARVRRAFASELAACGAAEPIRAPAPVRPAERKQRANALTAMVEKARAALLNVFVAVDVKKVDENDPFAESGKPELVTLGLGSGVIVDKSGLAISNWHVVDEATHADGSMKKDHAVRVTVFGGKTYPVRVLSISRENDLSLLQLELAPGEEVAAIELGDSDALAIGQAVAAIGNPHGKANTITYGVITAKEQKLKVRGRWADLEHLLETDAAINGGNSGGALLDLNGRLVGINSAGGGTFNNRGYAIAVDHVRRTMLTLLFQPYKLRSPDLGLRVIDDDGKVSVLDVDTRGPAAAAGVQAGDRITSLGGVPITWSPGFARTLAKMAPGEEVELLVDRKGQAMKFALRPVGSEVWSVLKQSGLLCRDLRYTEEPERVRQAVIALHRRITGDAAGEPHSIPEQVVAVSRVFAEELGKPVDIQPGDLLLALELQHADTGDPVFVHLTGLAKVRDLWNDRLLGTYEGSDWRCWIARGTEIRTVDLTVKRLFW